MEDKKLILLRDKAVSMDSSEVYEQFRRYLYSAVKPWLGQYNQDDLLSIANIGLMKAYKTYDSSKGLLFMTYLSRIVANEVLMYNRKENKHKGILSLDAPLSIDVDGNELHISDIVSNGIDYEELSLKDMKYEELNEVIAYLSEQEQVIIKDMYF